jgi:hypothetical protein
MKKQIPFHLIFTLLLLIAPLESFSILIGPITIESLILESRDIFYGEVADIESRWNENHSEIYSYAKLNVFQVFKGDVPDEIVLQIAGGTIGDTTEWVEDEAELSIGMEVIVHTFLKENGHLGIYCGEQGIYNVKNGYVEQLGITLEQFKELVDQLTEK